MPELTDVTIDKEIDARGSFCPGPLMELIRGMKALPVGGVLAVLSGDPGSMKRYSSLDSKGQARVYRGLSRAGIHSLCSA